MIIARERVTDYIIVTIHATVSSGYIVEQRIMEEDWVSKLS